MFVTICLTNLAFDMSLSTQQKNAFDYTFEMIKLKLIKYQYQIEISVRILFTRQHEFSMFIYRDRGYHRLVEDCVQNHKYKNSDFCIF